MAINDRPQGNNPVDQTPVSGTNHKAIYTALIAVIVILSAAVVYLAMGRNTEQPNNQQTNNIQTPAPTPTPTPTPNPTPNPSPTQSTTANWKSFTSNKCTLGYTLLYPPTYSVSENTDCNLVIKVENGLPLFDLYVSAVAESVTVSSMKDAMENEEQSKVNIAGVTGVRLDGKFISSTAGIEYDHTGSYGSSVVFTKNNRTFVFNAYDNGDRSLDYNNMIKNLSFK